MRIGLGVGSRLPAHCTLVSHVLLSGLGEASLRVRIETSRRANRDGRVVATLNSSSQANRASAEVMQEPRFAP